MNELAAALERALGRPPERAVPLARHSTYRLGGPAALFVEPASLDELLAVGAALARCPAPVLVVGKGSNVLVSDDGFPGLALRLAGAFEALDVDDTSARAGGGLALPVLARRLAAAGRAGLEFYVGIPGTVGGAVRMNAGGHGRETAEVLTRAWVVDLTGAGAGGTETVRAVDTLGLAYRRSALGPAEVVTGAELAVEADDPAACEARIEEIVRWRRQHQPGGTNAGSVFTNPPGDAAGRLIEACGLKGHRVGGAVVSEKHANFFQAEPGATAADVRRLVLDVQARVEGETGVRLEPELTMIGFG